MLSSTMQTRVSPMLRGEERVVAAAVESAISSLTYYNDRAKREELAKYSEAELRNMSEADVNSVLLARIDGKVAGFCLSRYDDGLIWLSWFGVIEEYRKRGIGRALLEGLERTLLERNAHKIWCDTRTENVRSQHVLEHAGFNRIVSLVNHWYGQDFILWEWSPR
jgi:ribosomal protein S18 acetylase RimI-like enzyme